MKKLVIVVTLTVMMLCTGCTEDKTQQTGLKPVGTETILTETILTETILVEETLPAEKPSGMSDEYWAELQFNSRQNSWK